MRKIMIFCVMFGVIAGGVFAMGGKTSMADQTFAPPEVKALGKIDVEKHDDYTVINFMDADHKVIKTLKLSGKVEGAVYVRNNYAYLLNFFYTYIAITELHFKRNTPEEYFHRGIEYEQSHTIRYYDTKGDLLFEKMNTIYLPEKVANTGNLVVCYQETPEEFVMDVSEDLKELPFETKLFVFAKDGSLIYEKPIKRRYGVDISENSNWMLIDAKVGDWGKLKNVYIRFDVQNREETIINRSEFNEYDSIHIGNDGWFLLEKSIEKGIARRYRFNYETGEKQDLGIKNYIK